MSLKKVFFFGSALLLLTACSSSVTGPTYAQSGGAAAAARGGNTSVAGNSGVSPKKAPLTTGQVNAQDDCKAGPLIPSGRDSIPCIDQ